MERVGESKRERERVWCCVGRQGFDSVGRGVCVRARERARKSERKRERVCVCVCVLLRLKARIRQCWLSPHTALKCPL